MGSNFTGAHRENLLRLESYVCDELRYFDEVCTLF